LASLEAGNDDEEDKDDQGGKAGNEFGFPSDEELAAVDARVETALLQPAASSVAVVAHGVVWQLPEGTGRKRKAGDTPPPAAATADTADKAKATKRARKQAALEGNIAAGKQGTLPK
jgi:hypothetical protein